MTAAAITALASALLVGLYLRIARARQIMDVPNERSAHASPTPHGGGVALLVAFAAGMLVSAWFYGPWAPSFITLAGAALLLMVLGLVDDLYHLAVALRLTLYAVVCLVVAAALFGTSFGPNPLVTAVVLVPLAAFVMLWSLNLFNFMDGIDGLAAIQTILACVGAAILAQGEGGAGPYVLFCALLAAAHAGFLCWNWPPAKIFMGDAGSVPTGFLLAGLAVLGALQGQLQPECWLILLAVFITDATWTLAWRMVTGQAFAQPHSLHAYQRLSRYWGSHLKVDMLLVAIVVFWLFPLAWAAQFWPHCAPILVILAYLPLVWGMAKMGRLE